MSGNYLQEVDKIYSDRKTLEEWLEGREKYLRDKIKKWPSDSSVAKCAQARLHEIKTIQLTFFNNEQD